MTDPRFTDPRYNDPPIDPVLRRDENVSGMWGWVAGLAVLALVAFIVAAAWNSDGNNTASNNPSAPITTGSSAPRNVMPPSTTGSGSTSPQPITPANRGTR